MRQSNSLGMEMNIHEKVSFVKEIRWVCWKIILTGFFFIYGFYCSMFFLKKEMERKKILKCIAWAPEIFTGIQQALHNKKEHC